MFTLTAKLFKTAAKEQFLTRADDGLGDGLFDSVKWALEKIGKPDTGEFHSAVLIGNEDSPVRIEFFRAGEPKYNQPPDWVWEDPDIL